ncbi:MAG: hypothetical protein M3Y93_00270 [Pseudomonadota bacterium]|nr:hypothetical protein [Pseudomonadota bacterium]
MNLKTNNLTMGLGFFLLGGLPLAANACATCGCSLSTDATTGYSTGPGWRINLDDTFIDQSQLRRGSSKATPQHVVAQPSDPAAGGGEIEKGTLNRYINLGVAYRLSADWGFSMQLPYVLRDHTTYGDQEQPYAPAQTASDQVSGARVSGIGDAKLLASFQGFLPTHNLGIQLGVKLATGDYVGETEDGNFVGHPVTFQNGPEIGQALDTNLQAGTGSTDLIVGGYYFDASSTPSSGRGFAAAGYARR